MTITWAIGTIAVSALIGCSPDLSERVPQATERGQLKLEPPPVTGVSSRAVKVWSSSGEAPRLFALALSESQVGSIRRGEPSEKVLDHEVVLIDLESASNNRELSELRTYQPMGLLAPATSYTVVSPRLTLKFITAANEPVLSRVWPRDGVVNRAVFCAESNAGLRAIGANPEQLWADDRVWFRNADAGDVEVGDAGTDTREWTLLGGDSPCFMWLGRDAALPPTHFRGFAVEPTVVTAEPEQGRSDAALSMSSGVAGSAGDACRSDEVSIERGCVVALDDRIVVRSTLTDTLWLVTGDAEAWFVSEQGDPGVTKGLRPDSDYTLHFSVFEPSGVGVESDLVVHTASLGSHVVINEVLADPLGLEPRGEWIELYNDGSNFVDFGGWALEDDGGRVELPPAQLAPFGYALLVNDTYERTSELDVVPDEDVFLIRLPSLGKSGLSNQGETLRLVDNSGMVVSSFPASPKPAPGVSVARREPWFMGAQTRGFGLHAAPFSSPGGRNLVGTGN